jgi:hypothetical protein
MSEQNPYAAPEADIALPSSGTAIDIINALPRLTTWAVIGLSIITFGLYSIYWLYNRTQKLNGVLSEELKIPNWTIMGAMISYTFYIGLSVAVTFIPDLAVLSGVFGVVYFVLFIIWVYKFRGAINTLTDTQRGDQVWIGPILTFFINIYYFQYKINQIHDNY